MPSSEQGTYITGLHRWTLRPRRWLRGTARTLRGNPNMMIGFIILTVAVTMAIFAPLLTTHEGIRTDPYQRLESPASETWFGTDHLGRGVYERTIFGSRISLLVGFSVAVIVTVFGLAIGLVTGYYRTLDNIVMRVMDGLMAFPSLLLALALIAVLGASIQNVLIAISVVQTPRMVRLVRSSVLFLREQMYVDAARAMGAPVWRILLWHIAPNTMAPIMVQATFVFALAIITEANLSFLGAGVPPRTPTWGNIMGQGRTFLTIAPWIVIFPGVLLALTVMAINLVGDGLRDALDPRLRRRM